MAGKKERVARSRLALEGTALGDAFGERFFVHPAKLEALIDGRVLPTAPVWHWTDDTAMATSVHEVLMERGTLDEDVLAARFAARYRADPGRGYGQGAHVILTEIGHGIPWRVAAQRAFGGQGSLGNGSAMRASPVGGYFADDLPRVVVEATRSARPTHLHPEGIAGAIAVAVTAALAVSTSLEKVALLEAVIAHVPEGAVRRGIAEAIELGLVRDSRTAASVLGNGHHVTCADTVPFALWCASQHIDDFEEAMWATVAGLGDRDTTCAIVGGIVALRVGEQGLPSWRDRREALPASVAP